MRATLACIAVLFLLAMTAAGNGTTANRNSAPGAFMPGATLGLDEEQIVNATISLQVADELEVEPLVRLAMVVSGLGESEFRVVPNATGSGYCGVFQAHPRNIPCDDTKEQATRFFIGGKGFQRGGAIKLARANPDMTPGTIATLVEASGQPGSFYDAHRARAETIIAAWQTGGTLATDFGGTFADVPTSARLTPKQVIDQFVLPLSRINGVPHTAAEIEAANERHSTHTTSGNVSDHKGPPGHAWAADLSDNWITTVGTPNMTRLAAALAERFKVAGWTGAGLVDNPRIRIGACYFRIQLIYLTNRGGNHFNHIHFGIRLVGC